MINIKNLVFGVAIFILTMFVTVYGVNTFYPQPEYNDYCTDSRPLPVVEKEGEICPAVCVEMYELKKEGVCTLNECGSGCGPDGVNTFDTLKQCEIILSGKDCYDLYDDAQEKYSKNVFMIIVPLGILVIVIGAYFFSLEAVGVGLMAGGAGTLVYGAGGYWRFADEWLKFLVSLVGLIAVIVFACWFNKKKKDFWKKFFFK